MLPIRHQSIFKSRWIAMLWAAGIIWSAVEFTGGLPGAEAGNNEASPDGTAPASNSDDATSAALSGAINTLQGLK